MNKFEIPENSSTLQAMDFSTLDSGNKLGTDRVNFLETFSKSCRRTIVEMVKQSQSGHPGGSLSTLDLIATLYAFRVTKTDEKVVISNGHISPAMYSVLAECGAVDKRDVIENFRKFGSKFEGHVTRHIDGIHYGTGPLGCGFSAAAGMAWSEKKNNPDKRVWCTIGDGEMQEGQVHEAALWAAQRKLGNLTVIVDYNNLQISGTLAQVCGIDVTEFFKSKGWKVVEIDGHNYEKIWSALNSSCKRNRPTAIIARTVMGKGVPGMEEDGKNLKSNWHGSTPNPDMAAKMLSSAALTVSKEENGILDKFRADRKFVPEKNTFPAWGSPMKVNTGKVIEYAADEVTDCRGAYGKALQNLAENNKEITAMSADLSGSVKTSDTQKACPEQYVEFGIAEQNMVSAAGGMSFSNIIPFASTFGAFISSRAKDQARVNDINAANVKMVATHCGLSVGEDGPTHQAIDDAGSFLGMFNTGVCEPADPNHCDRIIRWTASIWGNMYVRMGRAKLATLTKEDGSVFFDKNYKYEYGKCEILRSGERVTIIATGPCVHEALKAREATGVDAEIVIVSSIKKLDDTVAKSLKKTGKFITVEDHNPYSGLAAAIAKEIQDKKIKAECIANLAVTEYELSGKPAELYHHAKIDADAIAEVLKRV